MEIILEAIRPLGNAIARFIFANKLVEEDSTLSDGLGALSLLILLVLAGWLLLKVTA